MDSAIVNVLTSLDQNNVIETASWTVDILYEASGAKALIPPQNAPDGIAGRFSLRALEAIAVGIARNKASIMACAAPKQFISEKIQDFWQQAEVRDMSASGLRGTVRLQRTIPFGAQWFSPDA